MKMEFTTPEPPGKDASTCKTFIGAKSSLHTWRYQICDARLKQKAAAEYAALSTASTGKALKCALCVRNQYFASLNLPFSCGCHFLQAFNLIQDVVIVAGKVFNHSFVFVVSISCHTLPSFSYSALRGLRGGRGGSGQEAVCVCVCVS